MPLRPRPRRRPRRPDARGTLACSRRGRRDRPRHGRLRPGDGPVHVPRHRRAGPGRHAADGQGLARQGAEGDAVRADDGASEPIGVERERAGRAAGDLRLAPESTSRARTGCSPSRSAAGRSRRSATSSSSAKTAAPDVGAAAFPSETPTLANATLEGAVDLDEARSASSTASRSRTRSRRRSRSWSSSRRRSTAPAAPAARSSTSSAPCAASTRTPASASSTSRSTRTTTRRRARTRWVREWKLPSEPWVFLVGADGKIKDRFEGTVSVDELDAAVDKPTSSGVSRVFRRGNTTADGQERTPHGARSRLAVSRDAAGCCACSREVGAVGDKPATREGARAFRLQRSKSSARPSSSSGSCSRRGRTCFRRLHRGARASSSTTCRRSRSRRRGGSSTRRSGSRSSRGSTSEPLACASIAQIHGGAPAHGPRGRRQGAAAGDRGGGRARPRAASLADLVRRGALRDGPAAAAARRSPTSSRRTSRAELDFVEEAHSAELIARARRRARAPGRAGGDPPVRDRAACSCMERIEGEKVDARRTASIAERAAVLARELFRAYVQQITVHGVYHADPHRGNILLTAGRPARAARLRPARPARRRHAARARPAPARARAEPRRRRRRPDPRPLADDAALRRGRLRARAAPQAPALPLAAARRDPRRRGARRPAAHRARARDRAADGSRSSARRSRRPTRSPARSTRSSTRSSCSRRTALEVMLQRDRAEARAANLLALAVHAARAAAADAAAHRPARRPARDRDAQGRDPADRSRRARARRPLDREPGRRGDDHLGAPRSRRR